MEIQQNIKIDEANFAYCEKTVIAYVICIQTIR